MITRSQHNIHCPKNLPDGMIHWPKAHTTILQSSPSESLSFVAEALRYPAWCDTMAD